ncbi:hypothetical protein ABGB07_25675 [Micromonosporaceae bacterium B7E4]
MLSIDIREYAPAEPAPGTDARGAATGVSLLLAVFGLVAIVVGLQGLVTPDG